VIKLATHGNDLRKGVINKDVKTDNYKTVAFNVFAVAIGYIILIKSRYGLMKLPKSCPFGWIFQGKTPIKQHTEMDTQW